MSFFGSIGEKLGLGQESTMPQRLKSVQEVATPQERLDSEETLQIERRISNIQITLEDNQRMILDLQSDLEDTIKKIGYLPHGEDIIDETNTELVASIAKKRSIETAIKKLIDKNIALDTELKEKIAEIKSLKEAA